MRVLVTGGSGFVGKKLVHALINKNFDVNVSSRSPEALEGMFDSKVKLFKWNSMKEKIPLNALEDVEAIIHLMGEPVGEKRWTNEVKTKIRDSRIKSTEYLIRSINLNPQVKTIVGASALGIYGDRSDELLLESSTFGNGFLADVCKRWEEEFFRSHSSIRTVMLRTGVVLGGGGALKKMLPIFKLGLGGALGTGKQWMSWIHIDDLVSMYIEAVENKNMNGIFNAVSPVAVTNIEFTKTLANILNRPGFVKTPHFALKLLFGEMASVLTSSQKVSSKKIRDLGFKFKYSTLSEALRQIINS